MKTIKDRLLCVFLTLSMVSLNTYADDTEIFTGNGDVSDNVRPNVLFILDNSGSMNASLSDGTRRTRLQAMKDAFNQIITSVDNVNIGIMRFNTPGGAIAYPVTNIDEQIDIPFIDNAGIKESNDDAYESGTDQSVSLTSNVITMGYGATQPASSDISIPIRHEDDDAEENIYSGNLTVGHSQFNMDSSQVNALRFYGLDIPPGAVIQEAKIRFTSITNHTSSAVIRIEGEATNNPARFDHSDLNNITNRPRTSNALTWNVTEDWFRYREYYTPDISSILQEQIDHPDWDNNDAVVFIFDQQMGSYRSGFLYRNDRKNTQGLNGRASVLEVTYSVGTAGATQTTTGLRFQNVGIPQGATVTSATLGFTSAETNSDAATFIVSIENNDHAESFQASDNNLTDPINRPKFGDTVNWTVDGTWTADQVEPGPDVTRLVQAIVDRPGWCGNNAMALYFNTLGVTNRKIYSFDSGLDRQPTLTVSYEYDPDTAPAGTGCIHPIFSNYLTQTEHDAYQITRGSRSVNNNGNALRIGKDYMSGVRYATIPIKQGATIRSAYLKVTAHGDDNNDTVPIAIYGHDIDNSPAFPESRRNLSNRPLTNASVDWTPGNWEEDNQYDSPNIASVIQEIVSRPSWSAGNSLALLLKSNSSKRRYIYDWDGGTAKAAELIIEVENGGIDFSDNTVRSHIASVVEGLEARTWTPIVDTLYEAALYFRGAPMDYGAHREKFPQMSGTTDERYKRVSVAGSYSGGTHVLPPGCPSTNSSSSACDGETVTGSPTYISPIYSACQSNHIVLLTDGQANNNHLPTRHAINNLVSSHTGRNCETDSVNNTQRCSRDLVSWLANTDQKPSISGFDNIVNTHTIAFNLDSSTAKSYLSDLATIGGGQYKEADTAADLATAFNDILRSVLSQNATFVSPGATINQFNRLTHRNEIYFSLFKPSASTKWSGNLKRYKLLGDPPVISDSNDESAVDLTTGFFKANAKSVWSQDVDGANVELGGAAYQLPTINNRNIYTYLSSIDSPSQQLAHDKNTLHELNTNITNDMLGTTDSAKRNILLKWARGVDLLDWDNDGDIEETRFQMGDPLHSVPSLVTYENGETEADTKIVVFVGSNEGFLHAIDTSNGEEVFSFIPEELLSNIESFYDNPRDFKHPYGLDGSPTTWIHDVDSDGNVDPGDGDHVYLYIGMRRGGNNYYALDVTQLNSPKVLWIIEGGSAEFPHLGQTWSKPIKTRIMVNSTKKDVLVFTGGFDTNQDSTSVITPDNVGRAIYIVDAHTGERIWVGYNGATIIEGEHFADMDFSFPGDLSILDINQDGYMDQMYAADVGGQVWRFDVNNEESISQLIDGGVIASLAGTSESSARRFFNKPNVSIFSQKGQHKLAVSIGSGTRFNPLNTVIEDNFYTIFLSDVYSKPMSYTKLTGLDLVDRTTTSDNTPIPNGWFIGLPNTGEKVLASSVTAANTIFFNTYSPDSAANSCQAVVGQGRTYAVRLFNGNAAFDLSDDGSLDPIGDRSRLLQSGAIPPSPKLLISEEGILTLLVGPEQPYIDQNLGAIRTDRWFNSYWYEKDE